MERLRIIVLAAACVVVVACGSSTPSPSGSVRPSASRPVASNAAPPASAEASAAPSFVGEFAPIELKGKGDKQAAFEIPEDSIAIATLSHPGKGTFVVTAYDEDGQVTQQLVRTSGKYAGTILFDLKDHSTSFKVQAKGPWKITVKPAEAAKPWDGQKVTKGKGDQVLRLVDPVGDGTNLQLKTGGRGPYLIRAHSPEDDVDLMSGTSPAKVSKALPEGTDLLEIVGRGAWQLALGTN